MPVNVTGAADVTLAGAVLARVEGMPRMTVTCLLHALDRSRARLFLVTWLTLLGLWLPRTALAADTTVRLKSGGLVRGELMELQPKVAVRLRLADGEVRSIAWSEISQIDEAAPAPSPAQAIQAPRPETNPEIEDLLRQRADVDDAVPGVMMVVGGVAFLTLTPIGLILFAVDSACDSTSVSTSCHHVQGAAIVFTVLGVGSGVIGVWGLIKRLNNDSRRDQIDERIRMLRQGHALRLQDENSLAFDIAPRPGGGELRLALRF